MSEAQSSMDKLRRKLHLTLFIVRRVTTVQAKKDGEVMGALHEKESSSPCSQDRGKRGSAL